MLTEMKPSDHADWTEMKPSDHADGTEMKPLVAVAGENEAHAAYSAKLKQMGPL